jgi:hypothetical protein
MNANDNSRRRLPKVSTLIAVVALFAALGGSAIAAKGLITGKDIKKGTVTSKNVKDKTLKTKDLNPKTVKALQGQQGPEGPQGQQGPQGPAGLVNPVQGIDVQQNIGANDTETLITLNVPAGEYLVMAKTTLFSQGTDGAGCVIEANDEIIDPSQVTWEPAANNLDTPVSSQILAPAGTTKLDFDCSMAADAGSARDSGLIAVPTS